MIAIIDYDMGNVGSISNMLKKIGIKSIITRNASEIMKADKIIIPGVGSFDEGMRKINEYNLKEVILEFAMVLKKPILGICLGMQILGESSEEGELKGLGLIPFKNKKFKFENSVYKVPHMGWKYVDVKNSESKLVVEMPDNSRFYFVHSFYAECLNSDYVLMTSNHGFEFVAAVEKDNIYGTQFHPEKSHNYGMKILSNFVRT